MNIKPIIKQGRHYYANKHLRHQWIRKTIELKLAGKHATQTGGFARGTA